MENDFSQSILHHTTITAFAAMIGRYELTLVAASHGDGSKLSLPWIDNAELRRLLKGLNASIHDHSIQQQKRQNQP